MNKPHNNITIFVLVFIVTQCCGVSLDYFQESELKVGEEEDFMTSKSDTTTTLPRTPYRRIDGGNICTLDDKKTTKTNVSQDREAKNTPTKEYPDKETTVSTTLFNFLKFYHYDEDGDSVLRSFPTDKGDRVVDAKDKYKTINPIKKENSIRSTRLYSLEPAIDSFNFSDLYSPDANTWYVLDKAPCWDLPLIYGGSIEKNRNVFTIYRALLKEVVNDEENKVTVNNNNDMMVADPIKSRWCQMGPCYGDHILCDKRSTGDSTICGIGFVARTPKASQQKAIANTVNKLRNYVARGSLDKYPYLQPAANMKQIVYDKDLERMAVAWVRQCLPGPAPCASLNDHLVTQLECTKYHNTCCRHLNRFLAVTNCTPDPECMVEPLLGCLHTWFWSAAGRKINDTDVKCGHIEESTFNLAQLIWAETDKIGCAYGTKPSGDVRVVCSFAPGARYIIKTDYYCGLITLYNATKLHVPDVTDLKFLKKYKDIIMRAIVPGSRFKLIERNVTSKYRNHSIQDHVDISPKNEWGVAALSKIYKEGWVRHHANVFSNGTFGMLARLVTRYSFEEETRARCDANEPIYVIGEPASLCSETGAHFKALCYDYRDPTPEYRLVAILASISLFTLILFDLFRSSVRQGTY